MGRLFSVLLFAAVLMLAPAQRIGVHAQPVLFSLLFPQLIPPALAPARNEAASGAVNPAAIEAVIEATDGEAVFL